MINFWYFTSNWLLLRFLQHLMIIGLFGTLSSCIQLKGSYVPLTESVKNPYYQVEVERVYNPILKDTIEYTLVNEVLNPGARPYRDTVEFISGKRVRAWSRPNTISSCSMKVSEMEECKYSLRKDTLNSKHVQYLVRGDTLYPLHRGSIYVKE